MQSRISFFNGTVFKKNISHYWPLWLVFLVYLICQIPINIFLSVSPVDMINSSENVLKLKTDAYFNALANSLTPTVCFAAGVIAAMAVFHFNFYTRSAHAFHSFPVRREELFFTAYFSGFLFYTVPLLLSFLMGACVCALKGITALEYLLLWFLLMEGMCFFFYNMTILVGMFTGQFFAVPLLTLILNYLYVGCRYVVFNIMGMISYGLSGFYSMRLVSFLSPLYFMIGKVGFSMSWVEQESIYMVSGCKYVAIYAGLGLIGGIAAFFMYRKRRMECISDILAIHLVKPIFRWVFAGGISMLFATVVCGSLIVRDAHTKFLFILMLVLSMGVICFFLADMLIQRKLRIWSRRRFLECGIYTLFMALFLIGLECDVFGMERRIPEISEIEKAQLHLYYPFYGDEEVDIEQIRKFHRQIIESKEEFEDYYADGELEGHVIGYVQIQYLLKDGTPFVRNYEIPADEGYLKDKGSLVSEMREYACDMERYLKGNLCPDFEETEMKSISLEVFDGELDLKTVPIEKKDWEMFFEALKADVLEGNILTDPQEDYEQEDDRVYWNSLCIELHSSKGIKDYWDEIYTNGVKAQNVTSYLNFNRDCSHILEVLEKLSLINGTDRRLLTGKEYEQISNELMEE